MESQRTKLLVGFSISVVGVLVTYAVYKTFRQSKGTRKRASPSANLAAPVDTNPAESPLVNVDPDEFLKSTPTAASSECNLLDNSDETSETKLEQSFEESSFATEQYGSVVTIPQEETVMPSEINLPSSSPVDLDKTVTLNSSDFSSRSLIDVDHSDNEDSYADTSEMVAEQRDYSDPALENQEVVDKVVLAEIVSAQNLAYQVSDPSPTPETGGNIKEVVDEIISEEIVPVQTSAYQVSAPSPIPEVGGSTEVVNEIILNETVPVQTSAYQVADSSPTPEIGGSINEVVVDEIIPDEIVSVQTSACPAMRSYPAPGMEESTKEVITVDLTSPSPVALEDSSSEVIEVIPMKVTPECGPVTDSNPTEIVVEETVGVTTVDLTCTSPPPSDAKESVDVTTPVPASSNSTQNALEDLEHTMQSHEALSTETLYISTDTIVSKSTEQINENLEEINKSFSTAEKEMVSVEVKLIAKEDLAEAPDAFDVSGNDSGLSSDSLNGSRSITADSGIGLSTGSSNVVSSNNHSQPKDEADNSENVHCDKTPSTELMNGSYQSLSNGASVDHAHMTDADSLTDQCNGGRSSALDNSSPISGTTEDTKSQSELTTPRSSLVSLTGSSNSPRSSSSQTSADGVNKPKHVTHRFMMPAKMCGLFIGKNGKNISALKHHTNTQIKIVREPAMYNMRYCEVTGTEKDVTRALHVIRKQYPNVDVSPVDKLCMKNNFTLSPDRMQLHLPMGVLVDAIVSNIVSAGHVFVQQPTHPSFSSYQRLADCLNSCYADGSTVPPLPDSVEDGVLCMAPMNGVWYRAHIMSFTADRAGCEVKLVDVGGYAMGPTVSLRQIRQDFLGLPFQAVECYLCNIEPLDGESFSLEAQEALHQMTAGRMVQCQPRAVADNNVPYIHIVTQVANQVVMVNRELANRGLVKWFNVDG